MKKVSSKRGGAPSLLLDVNVLLALAWPNHQFHTAAVQRLDASNETWATCALTQIGFIRLSANPAVVGAAKTPAEAAGLLWKMVQDTRHRYLSDLPSPAADSFRPAFARLVSYRQVTDTYLAALAEHSGAKLLTFDARLAATMASPSHVELLAP